MGKPRKVQNGARGHVPASSNAKGGIPRLPMRQMQAHLYPTPKKKAKK